jgi:hypothetical protein
MRQDMSGIYETTILLVAQVEPTAETLVKFQKIVYVQQNCFICT